MLNRRHIRTKVMQTMYGLETQEKSSLPEALNFQNDSITRSYDLYLLMLDLIVEVHAFAKAHLEKNAKKILATPEEKKPNTRFIDNEVLVKIASNALLQDQLEIRKLRNWRLHDEYVTLLFEELVSTEFYKTYLLDSEPTFKKDRSFVKQMYTEVIAPNEKVYDYLEDEQLTWLDDYALVNTTVLKRLEKLKPQSPERTLLPSLFKNDEDRVFGINLLENTFKYNAFLTEEVTQNTPNWDKDRIADVDMVLIKMALCEFLKFPTIPVKVTINEYLEIAKEYSTPKSSIFINGILDKLVKLYSENKKLKKTGRGLQE